MRIFLLLILKFLFFLSSIYKNVSPFRVRSNLINRSFRNFTSSSVTFSIPLHYVPLLVLSFEACASSLIFSIIIIIFLKFKSTLFSFESYRLCSGPNCHNVDIAFYNWIFSSTWCSFHLTKLSCPSFFLQIFAIYISFIFVNFLCKMNGKSYKQHPPPPSLSPFSPPPSLILLILLVIIIINSSNVSYNTTPNKHNTDEICYSRRRLLDIAIALSPNIRKK